MEKKKILLHRRLRLKRIETRFTKEQISSILSLHVDEYTQFESGNKVPPKEILEDLAAFYGLTLDAFLTNTSRLSILGDE